MDEEGVGIASERVGTGNPFWWQLQVHSFFDPSMPVHELIAGMLH